MDIELHIRGKAKELPKTLAELSAALNGPRVSVAGPTVEQVLKSKIDGHFITGNDPATVNTPADDNSSASIEDITQAEINAGNLPGTPTDAPRDSRGCPHDPRIHTSNKGVKANGEWKRKPKITDELFNSVEAELLANAVKPEPAAAPAAPAPVAPGTAPIAPPAPVAAAVPTGVAGEVTTMLGDVISRGLEPDPSFYNDFGLPEGVQYPDIAAIVCAFLGMYDPELEKQGLAGLTTTSEDNLIAIKHGIKIIWPSL